MFFLGLTEKFLHEFLRGNVIHGDFVLSCRTEDVLVERRRSDAKGTVQTRQNADRHRWTGGNPRGERNEDGNAARLTPVVRLNVQRLDVFVVTT